MIIENIRNIAIGISIMMLLPLVTHVGTRLIIKVPSFPSSQTYKHDSKEYQALLQQYNEDKTVFEKYYFYVATAVGIIAIIAGIITPIAFLGMGFILGGVFCLLYGYLQAWNELNDLIKFASLLLALILLIAASFKFVKK